MVGRRLVFATLVAVPFLAALASAPAAEIIPFRSSGWKYVLGTQEASNPTDAWRASSFDDAAWLPNGATTSAPIGYPSADATGLEATIQTVIPTGTAAGYTCIFLRKAFVVNNPSEFTGLALQVRYDDGFAVWLNGVLVGSAGVSEPYTISTIAVDHDVIVSEAVLTPSAGLLVAGNNVLAVQVFNAYAASSDLFIDVQLTAAVDDAPAIAAVDPPPASTVRSLTFINVIFSENVAGVDASDLLINSVAATGIATNNARDYTFYFPEPATDAVTVAWIPNPGITDLDGLPTTFAPGPAWNYILDPTIAETAIISEFMADNASGIKDDDGTRSDWIEIYNQGLVPLSLEGWFLTDSRTNLAKWRFPNVILGPNKYLLVWASEKNRADPTKPLHTNFKLEKGGEFLALVNPLQNVVSAFDPVYPAQLANISYGRDRADPNLVGYYISPTPGAQNTLIGPGVTPEPVFSEDSGVFTNDTITVTLSAPAGVIRYTLDGNVPTNTSPVYTAPITVGSNVVIKARAFQAGLWPSPVVSRTYHFLDASTRDFNSNLPLVILSTAGRPIVQGVAPGVPRTPGSLVVVDTFRGRTSLQGKPDFIGLAEFEVFGQTSAGFAKQPFRIEIQDELRNDRRVPLLGMPAEADWKLRNPYADKCLMNDFLALELHEKMGHYAVRRRFVEVFVDSGGGKVTYPQDYIGVMVLMETIEAGPDRVNIREVTPSHTTEPEITGGYVWKKEKDSPGDVNFTAAGQSLKIHEPKPNELRNNPTSALTSWPGANYTPGASNQLSYLVAYLNAFNTAMNATNWLTATGTNHYSHYIDVDSFVDQHWIVEFTKNIDGYRLGNYMQKDRNGKIKMDPIWDWELSFGNADYLSGGNTNTWYYPQLSAADHIWLRRLMGAAALPNSGGDPDFIQKVIDRWGVLRTNVLNGDRVLARIDEIAGALAEAAARNYSKYPVLNTYLWPNPQGPPTWDVDYTQPTYDLIISEMKKWTLGRYLWIDAQFPKAPTLSLPGGDIVAGSSLILAAPTGTIYYTLDGSDPRAMQANGAVAAGALTYSGPVILNDNARVIARARVGTTWSPPAIATYVVRRPRLVITEIMYHPLPPPAGSTNIDEDFEYVELRNVGGDELAIGGYTLGGGVDFTFPARTLAAGERVLVVRNQAAFLSRYPGLAAGVAGQFAGNLANDGERLVLQGRLREPIMDFEYDDQWHRITDGFGFSLVVVDDNAAVSTWSLASNWRPSGAINGSPAQGDGTAPSFPQVVINEALTHSDPAPPADTIELANPGSSPANIGGWYLTDDFRTPKKFRILNGSTIPAHSFITLDETDFNEGNNGNIAFSLSSSGDEVYLFSADLAGELTGYVHGFKFGAQRSGITFVRHVTSQGDEVFVASSSPTLGAANSPPLAGPVVISEIMYRPPDVFANGTYWENFEDEYIELHNPTGFPVSLFDPSRPASTWKLEQAVEFVFPPGVVIPAGGYLLVVRFNPATDPNRLATFRARYGISSALPVYGPYQGELSESDATVALYLPDTPEASEANGEIPSVLVDAVRYRDRSPWPMSANGAGHALHRLDALAYGNDPVNWAAGDPSPGAAFVGGTGPTITTNPADVTAAAQTTAVLSGAGAGPGPIHYQWRHNGSTLGGATNSTLVLPNVQASQAGRYQLLVLNPFGSALSTDALLTVLVPIKIHQHPASQSVSEGAAAAFSVVAESFNPPLRYQWLRDGIPLANATNSSHVISNAGENDDATTYTAALTDSGGTIFSQGGRLTVLIPPQLLQPVPRLNLTAVAGETVTLGVRLRGTKPTWVQWRKFNPAGFNEGLVKSGFVSASEDFLVLPNIGTNAAGFYAIQFTNIAGGTLSTGGVKTNALLTVLADANANGIPDTWESAYFGSATGADANADSDGDGMKNRAEYIAGTNPTNAASYLKVDGITATGSALITFQAVAGRTYTVEYTDDLEALAWSRLANVVARSATWTATVTDPTPRPNRYYRIVTPRQP